MLSPNVAVLLRVGRRFPERILRPATAKVLAPAGIPSTELFGGAIGFFQSAFIQSLPTPTPVVWPIRSAFSVSVNRQVSWDNSNNDPNLRQSVAADPVGVQNALNYQGEI